MKRHGIACLLKATSCQGIQITASLMIMMLLVLMPPVSAQRAASPGEPHPTFTESKTEDPQTYFQVHGKSAAEITNKINMTLDSVNDVKDMLNEGGEHPACNAGCTFNDPGFSQMSSALCNAVLWVNDPVAAGETGGEDIGIPGWMWCQDWIDIGELLAVIIHELQHLLQNPISFSLSGDSGLNKIIARTHDLMHEAEAVAFEKWTLDIMYQFDILDKDEYCDGLNSASESAGEYVAEAESLQADLTNNNYSGALVDSTGRSLEAVIGDLQASSNRIAECRSAAQCL